MKESNHGLQTESETLLEWALRPAKTRPETSLGDFEWETISFGAALYRSQRFLTRLRGLH